MPHRKSILIIGYGNPFRLDDGLGPILVEKIRKKHIANVEFEVSMMLNIEYAEQIGKYDIAIFADADTSGAEPFYFKQIRPREPFNFNSHHVKPDLLLGLAYKLYHAKTTGYILGVRGYLFHDFGEIISEKARKNLDQAEIFLSYLLRSQKFFDYNI